MNKYPEFVPGKKEVVEEEVKEDVKVENVEKVEDVYTVTYFPLYGKAESLRVALELAKVKWVDNIV